MQQVLLVVCSPREEEKQLNPFMTMLQTLRGPVEHIELAFYDAQKQRLGNGFWLTAYKAYASFAPRDYANIKLKMNVRWFSIDIPSISQVHELMDICQQVSDNKRMIFAAEAMIMSVLRIPSQGLAKQLCRVLLGEVEVKKGTLVLGQQPPEPHYCASAVATVLKEIGLLPGINPHQCTAHDVLLYCIRLHNSKEIQIDSAILPPVSKVTNEFSHNILVWNTRF